MSPEPEPIARECVEGYLFATPPLELLIFRRPPSRGEVWVPVSGKVDPGDADFEAAVRREVAEETGWVARAPAISLNWHVVFRADSGELWRLHAYALRVDRGFEPTLCAEHEAWAWVTVAEAERRFHFPDNREALARVVALVDRGVGSERGPVHPLLDPVADERDPGG